MTLTANSQQPRRLSDQPTGPEQLPGRTRVLSPGSDLPFGGFRIMWALLERAFSSSFILFLFPFPWEMEMELFALAT